MRRIETSVTVKTAIAEMYEAKKQDALSKTYLSDLRQRLSRFERVFGSRPIASISVGEIETWLRELGLSPASRKSYHQRLSTLWAFALGRNWVESNLLTKVARAKVVGPDIGILTPEQLSSLLANASPETLPFWAIGGFSGMRVAGLRRLDWGKVDFDGGLIEVSAQTSKTAEINRMIDLGAAKQEITRSQYVENFAQLQKHAKRAYSLRKVIRELGDTPARVTGIEREVSEELQLLNPQRRTGTISVD